MTDNEIIYKPIGYIRSNFNSWENTPKSSKNNDKHGEIVLNPEYLEGIADMKVGEKYVIVFHFHKSEGYKLTVPIHGDGPMTGLFSTHAPFRPNPIGISTITISNINKNIIEFEGVDMFDGTPILDIKNDTCQK